MCAHCCTIVIGEEFEELNVDGGRMAVHTAESLGIDRLVLLTNAEGLVMNGNLIQNLTLLEATRLRQERRTLLTIACCHASAHTPSKSSLG